MRLFLFMLLFIAASAFSINFQHSMVPHHHDGKVGCRWFNNGNGNGGGNGTNSGTNSTTG